jgi:predicted enzyme related to lactoylglutathione lyase
VDESTTTARDLGATVLQEPADVVDSGRMAVFADPQGAAVAVWQPRAHIGAQLVNVPGALTWNELRTKDQPAAVRFYVDLFGWGTEDNDMGPAGTYTIVKVGDRATGGIMPLSTESAGVPPHWAPYFVAEDTDKTTARVQELGGTVVMPPVDVPNGRIAVVTDPQGASLSLFAGPLDP